MSLWERIKRILFPPQPPQPDPVEPPRKKSENK